MKQFIILSTACLLSVSGFSQKKFENALYGFKGEVPSDWTIYAEINDDEDNHAAIMDWGLPKVYSKLEKTSIENAVSITAYNRSDIKNIEELQKFEFERVASVLTSKERIASSANPAYVIMSKRNGFTYKTKTEFVFKDGIGYVLIYTATPGTYDINLSKFDDFIKTLSFNRIIKVDGPATSISSLHFDGLYIAKTGEINIPNNKMDIYTYIRFYNDGMVLTQAVTANDPASVSKWFNKEGRFERKGNYKANGSDITFTVNNNGTEDKAIEGAKEDSFIGKINDQNKLLLKVKYASGETKEFGFEFVKTN